MFLNTNIWKMNDHFRQKDDHFMVEISWGAEWFKEDNFCNALTGFKTCSCGNFMWYTGPTFQRHQQLKKMQSSIEWESRWHSTFYKHNNTHTAYTYYYISFHFPY